MNAAAHYDIAIVGGGLAGSSLALALSQIRYPLSQKPLRIAIIETKPFTQTAFSPSDGRHLALAYGSARIYQSLGMWDILGSKAYPLNEIHVSEKGSFGFTRFKAAAEKVPALGYVLSLNTLQETLIKTLEEKNHIQWFCPDTVIEVRRDNNLNFLQLEKGMMLSAELVIAADGANSAIRTLLNIPIETQHYGEDALVTTVDATQLTHTAYERFTAKGVIAILPISDTRAVLIWTGPSEWIAHLRQMDLQVFLKTLQTYFGYRAGKLTNPGKFHVYPLQLIVAQKIVQDGVVLIGHAAHTLHPLAAQGFNLSLRDISTLAEMIETRISTGKALFDLQWLKAYSQLRESDQKTIIRLTHRLRDLFSQDLFPLKAARSLGLSACDLFPPIKSALARKAMGIAGRLPRAD